MPKCPRISYSYDSEDLLLEKIITKELGFYIDIGAHDPINYSNTYLLHNKGWRGINIDANPLTILEFNKKRKECININCGVSDIEGEFNFYISENPLLSSFDKSKVETAKKEWNFDFKTRKINTYRLESLLDQYLPKTSIDLLNIDVEGLELNILASNNWQKYSPKIILIELHERYIENVLSSDIYKFLTKRGYKLISKTFITLIFERHQ